MARQFAQLLRFIVELRWEDSAREEVNLHVVVIVAQPCPDPVVVQRRTFDSQNGTGDCRSRRQERNGYLDHSRAQGA